VPKKLAKPKDKDGQSAIGAPKSKPGEVKDNKSQQPKQADPKKDGQTQTSKAADVKKNEKPGQPKSGTTTQANPHSQTIHVDLQNSQQSIDNPPVAKQLAPQTSSETPAGNLPSNPLALNQPRSNPHPLKQSSSTQSPTPQQPQLQSLPSPPTSLPPKQPTPQRPQAQRDLEDKIIAKQQWQKEIIQRGRDMRFEKESKALDAARIRDINTRLQQAVEENERKPKDQRMELVDLQLTVGR
jgi:hypothetical protein